MPAAVPDRTPELAALGKALASELDAVHAAREITLGACRRTIQACSSSIRAVHRLEIDRADHLAGEAASWLRQAHEAVRLHPALAGSGPLHDAEKEYAEARLTAAMVADRPLPDYQELQVAAASWLNGLAEAASELRRHLLDRLRDGDLPRGEVLLGVMGDVYDTLVAIDFPDAVTGGLRRTTDALRAVLERTRADLTTTLLQARLQAAIEDRLPSQIEGPDGGVSSGGPTGV